MRMRRARLRVRPSQRWSRMALLRSRTGGGGRSRSKTPAEPYWSRWALVTCSRRRSKELRSKPSLQALQVRVALSLTTEQLDILTCASAGAAGVATVPTRRPKLSHRSGGLLDLPRGPVTVARTALVGRLPWELV